MAQRGECPDCGALVALRKDSTLYAHKDDGEQCPGGGQPAGVSGTVGLDKGDPFEDTEDIAEGAPTPTTPMGGFEWQTTVKAPCPYLTDPGWHLANGYAAEAASRAAGHAPSGEAVHTGTVPSADGRTLVLLYRVPVR